MIAARFSRDKKKRSHLTDTQEDPTQNLMKPKFYFTLRGRSMVIPEFNRASSRQDAEEREDAVTSLSRSVRATVTSWTEGLVSSKGDLNLGMEIQTLPPAIR
jgi:hypothetical protein